jgi:5-methylcytosine-specific restriction endonuclease McrA
MPTHALKSRPVARKRLNREARLALWAAVNGRCEICGEAVPFETMHLDHREPLCGGGADRSDNLAVTHPRCNLRKLAHDLQAGAYPLVLWVDVPEALRMTPALLRQCGGLRILRGSIAI